MKANMNIITKAQGTIEFTGFDDIDSVSATITVKVFGSSLVITPKELPELENRFVFKLVNKKSDDDNLYKLIDEFCKSKNTAFVKVDSSYHQADNVDVPDDYTN